MTTPDTTTVIWEPTPEDPTIEWTRPDPHLGGLYAVVAETSHLASSSADYDLPHRITTWTWFVYEDVTGTELAAGDAQSRLLAQQVAVGALNRFLIHEHA